jgi:hypothetical protein
MYLHLDSCQQIICYTFLDILCLVLYLLGHANGNVSVVFIVYEL